MSISADDLRRNFEGQSTEALLARLGRGGLTDTAESVLKSVLESRGVHAAERDVAVETIQAAASVEDALRKSLADRLLRWVGQMIDMSIVFGIIFVGYAVAQSFDSNKTMMTAVWLAILYLFLADGLPGGQSLGKKVLGMAVIDERTKQPCGFFQSFVRNILLALLGPLDWIFIFGEKKKRLGDMAANTIVVRKAR